jgi:hypothetical protein
VSAATERPEPAAVLVAALEPTTPSRNAEGGAGRR